MRQTIGSKFYGDLESVRGVASVSVVAGHCYLIAAAQWRDAANGSPTKTFLDAALNPQPSVLLFFVLSGFVLGCLLDKVAITDAQSYARYLLRRLFRLVPASWASIALAVVLSGAAYSWRDILSAAAFVSFRPNTVLWTMHVELLASAVLPALYWVVRRCGVWVNAATFVFLTCATFSNAVPVFVQFLIFFYVGLVVSHVPANWAKHVSPSTGCTLAIIATVAMQWLPDVVAGNDRALHYAKWQPWLWSEIIPTFMIVYLVTAQKIGPIRQILTTRPTRFVGKISFGIYLLHLPVLYAVMHLIKFEDAGLIRMSAIFLAAMAITIPLAAVLHRWIELPFIALGRSFSDPAVGVSGSLRALRRQGRTRQPARP